MHTEDQAKALWCPMVRHASLEGEGSGSFNRGGQGNEESPDGGHYHCCCIASKCAMWRWGTFIAPPVGAMPGTLASGVNHRAEWGYCGLAGRPEVAG